jgi:hypothetical protein
MSGSDLAYHLRPNKAIERNLFIALLERVGRVRNISDYEYIGFGGPMLEDYKALHASLRIGKMHSIERDLETYKRQRFNKPAAFIQLHQMDSGEFFRTHQFAENGTIVWLDYTDAGSLKSQLDELLNVVTSLDCYDIVKITLNASVSKLGGDDQPTAARAAFRLNALKERIGDYAPINLTPADMQVAAYPMTLQRCVQQAVSTLPTREGGQYFQILSSFVYADGQQMLTITGIVFKTPADTARTDFVQRARMEHWPFSNMEWAQPKLIAVPSLTAKERMRLDEALPLTKGTDQSKNARLERKLGYQPSREIANSLAHYARYYRIYPHFSRVVL